MKLGNITCLLANGVLARYTCALTYTNANRLFTAFLVLLGLSVLTQLSAATSSGSRKAAITAGHADCNSEEWALKSA